MMKTFDFQRIPIVDIVNDILVDSAKRGASDIHFDPYADHLLIRIRIDGILYDYSEVPQNMRDYLITRIKTIARMNITESRLPQDGAIKATLQGVDLDLRVSSLPVSTGEKVVIRILDYSMSMSGLDELGFSEENYKKVLEMISVPNGIILVTGATGSGKSTTLYSILQYLNTSQTNIITVEDPIEMDISGINQVQANSKIGLTFANALRSILRQDPNIIMIGEIRDTETARIAIRASITGHLVLSTLHTNTSLNTIERLIDMDVQKYLLSSALEGVISQKLARKLCEHCKVLRPTSKYEKLVFKAILNKDVDQIYDTKGCEHCQDGYKGRIPIHEVLKITQQIRDALSEDAAKEEFRNLVYGESDTITMLQDGLQKVLDGKTSFEEILKLIELEDDDQISNNETLKKAIIETKAKMSLEENADEDNKILQLISDDLNSESNTINKPVEKSNTNRTANATQITPSITASPQTQSANQTANATQITPSITANPQTQSANQTANATQITPSITAYPQTQSANQTANATQITPSITANTQTQNANQTANTTQIPIIPS